MTVIDTTVAIEIAIVGIIREEAVQVPRADPTDPADAIGIVRIIEGTETVALLRKAEDTITHLADMIE